MSSRLEPLEEGSKYGDGDREGATLNAFSSRAGIFAVVLKSHKVLIVTSGRLTRCGLFRRQMECLIVIVRELRQRMLGPRPPQQV